MSHIHDVLRSEMKYAQARHIEAADNSRLPAPVFKPGDLVWLDARNLRTRRPSKKLENKHLGPFTVLRPIGSHAYEFHIPETMTHHRTFPVSLLNPAPSDPLPGQIIPPPLPVVVDGEEEWFVDEILDSRWSRGNLQYLVKWTGHDSPTWEPETNLSETEAAERFHQLYPDKPSPLVGTRA